MSDYQIGDRPTLQVRFTNPGGAPADPTTITFTLTDPSGAVVTGTQANATNPAVGTWEWMVPAAFDKSGLWTFTAVGSDGVNAGGSLVISVGQPTAVQARQAAEMLLWALTGRRYGLRTLTAEKYRVASCGSGTITPYKGSDGAWHNGCNGGCCRLELFMQPVQSVTEVRVNGTVVTDWTLTGNELTVPGGCSNCGDCGDPAIEVDYVAGIPWPASALAALAELQAEFLHAINGEPCRLSVRATAIVRQGITVNLDSAAELASERLTGLPLADGFILAVNPNRLVARSRVHPIDAPVRVG